VAELNFGKQLRLLNSADYQSVFDTVKHKAFTKEVMLLAAENGIDSPRLGIIISRKVSKRAVDRNRIKRQIREHFRLNQHELPAMDVIALVKPPANTADNAFLQQQLNYLWRKLNKNVQKEVKTPHN
jgi:ribonuclease P protein component